MQLRLLFVAVALLGASPARAAGEDEWQVSLRAGAAVARADGRHPAGGAVGAEVERGLDDAWALRAGVLSSFHPVSEKAGTGLPGGTLVNLSGSAGLTYSLDVLRLVPWFQVGVAVMSQRGAVLDGTTRLGLEGALGTTYLIDRHWGIGAVAIYQFLPVDLSGGDALSWSPFVFTLAARVSWTK